jgi:O-antigen ligase
MERATKVFLIGWACAAIAVEAWLLRGGWRGLPMLTLGAFAAGALLAMWDRRAVGLVLVFAYVFPAIIRIGHGQYHVSYGILWASALVGAVAPDGLRTSWHIPTRWRGLLVCWALVVAFSAPIVMGREFDFNPVLLLEQRMPTSMLGSVPGFVVVWVAQVALTLVLGVLWFDWLFGASDLDPHAWIVTPLAMSALAMASVAIYQLFADVSFLNETVYGNIGRASGTVFDANVCGTVAALWIGGTILWARRLGRWRPYMLIGGVAATWLAVWASGSRTAFAAAVLVTAFSLATQYAARGDVPAKAAVPRVLLAAGLVIGLLVLLANANLALVGPVKRVRDTLPELSAGSMRDFAVEMWSRSRYGPAATAMIRESPFFGVGVGSFHLLVSDFARLSSPGGTFPPDNAQNWYRHQLAEVGLLGSVGWIAWVVLFAGFVLRRHDSSPPAAWTVRGMLLAFAMISLLGMPGQDVSVTITFWTLAFWYVSLVGVPSRTPAAAWRSWAVIAAIVVAHAAGTAHLAATQLRVPVRAQHAGWPYSYGFYGPEPDGEGGEYRWARQRAVAVINAPGRWMALTVWVNHFDIGRRPVDTKVWLDGNLVIDSRLESAVPVTKYLRVPDGEEWVLVETRVSRVIRPSAFGVPDDRELGLLVKWSFLAGPPPRL